MCAYLDAQCEPCGPLEANFVLLEFAGEALPAADVIVPYYSRLTNESVCVLVQDHGYKAVYVELAKLTALTPKTVAVVGGMLSGNFRAGLTDLNHADYYEQTQPTLPMAITIPQVVGAIEALPTSAITQDHHLFIRTRELKAMLNSITDHKHFRLQSITYILQKAEQLSIDNKVSITTFTYYISCAPLWAVTHLMNIIKESISRDDLNSILKFESQCAKQSQSLFRDDLAVVYELNVLFNREDAPVDWEKERDNRVNVNTVPLTEETVYMDAMRIFSHARKEGSRAKRLDWDTYWATRWSSLPGGAVVSQYPEDNLIKSSLTRPARNKAAWFAANAHSSQRFWLDRKREIYAATSTKYEWGKVRALYGADVTSFLHADFGMHMCEDTLPTYFPVGSRANEKYVTDIIDKFSTGIPLCFDYDDFNSQHSTLSMRAVLQAWLVSYQSDLSEEQIASVYWTIDSIGQQRVNFRDLDQTVFINGTLLSGWRLTSFMNTVLNRVYLMQAGINENTIAAVHNGDDMFSSVVNMQNAVDLLHNANKKKIRAQVSKTNIGTIGEFLRIDTRSRTKTGRQYLARAIATATHGRVETGQPHDFRAVYTAMQVRAESIKARGGDEKVSHAVYSAQMKFARELFSIDDNTFAAITTLHPVQGGMNLEGVCSDYKIVQVTDNITQQDLNDNINIRQGMNEYIEYLRAKFDIAREDIDYYGYFKNGVQSMYRRRITYKIVIEDDPNVRNYIGQYKSMTKSGWISPISQARTLGYVTASQLFNIPGDTARKIRNAINPIRYMSVIL